MKEVAAMLKALHAQEDAEAARSKARDVITKLEGMKLSKAAAAVQEGVGETLTYFAFPREHHRHIYTNNPLEALMKQIRRRTRVVGAFPDGHSALMLAAARLRHIAGTQWGLKRYMNMDRLKEIKRQQQEKQEGIAG
jgi:transposase-like protein